MVCIETLWLTCLQLHVGLVWHDASECMHIDFWQSRVLHDMQHVITMRPAPTRIFRQVRTSLWSKDQAAAVSCFANYGLLVLQRHLSYISKGIPCFSLKPTLSIPAVGLVQLMSSGTWYISSGSSAGDKDRLATIKKGMENNTHSANVFLQGNSSQHFAQPIPDYSARGDFQNRSFFIYRGTIPVAEVQDCLPSLSILLDAYVWPFAM